YFENILPSRIIENAVGVVVVRLVLHRLVAQRGSFRRRNLSHPAKSLPAFGKHRARFLEFPACGETIENGSRVQIDSRKARREESSADRTHSASGKVETHVRGEGIGFAS